jgi:hypothetical protein
MENSTFWQKKVKNKKYKNNIKVFINELGEQYIINAKGEREIINKQIFESYKPKIEVDANGNKFMINEKGERTTVFLNEFGEECIKDENGYIVPLNQLYKNPNNQLSKFQQ